MAKISVIIPVYNVEKYLEQCLNSVINQTLQDLEIIIVNDGSTDNSLSICREYAKQDKRIRLINKQNGGCASARQCGLKLATSKYVGFIDPDDFIDHSMYEKLFNKTVYADYDMIYCGFYKYYNNTGKKIKVEENLNAPWSNGVYEKKYINRLINEPIGIWRAIYKLEVIKKNDIKFYKSIKQYDDLPFRIEMLTFIKSIISVPEYLYFYRLEREGQDVAIKDKRLFVFKKIFRKIDKFLFQYGNEDIVQRVQLIKLQTHSNVLAKIESKYFIAYAKFARKDIMHNVNLIKNLKIILIQNLGIKFLFKFILIISKQYKLYKFLRKNK
ncbi:MAG: hypothetical protein ATN32_04720 [Candidatus Epulonipiscium fishelsonii]|nr:MAG: hypothetical protein ATN32_04720 [Epulopiscium sp. AS2M-Bin002]